MSKTSYQTVESVHHGALRLYPNRLTQVGTQENGTWAVLFPDFRSAFRKAARGDHQTSIRIYEVNPSSGRVKPSSRLWVTLRFPDPSVTLGIFRYYRIGCEYFTAVEFEKIRKAAFARKTTKRAKAAKAGA